MSVDRMKQLQRNTVTNADVIDGALVLKRYDGSRLSVDSGTSGVELQTAPNGSKAIVVTQGEGGAERAITLMASADYEGDAILGFSGDLGLVEDEDPSVPFARSDGQSVRWAVPSIFGVTASSVLVSGTTNVQFDGPLFTFNSAGLVMANLPTVDPAVTGAVWNDAGTLKISAG